MKKSVSVIFGGLLCASILSVSLISSLKNESKDVEGYSTSTLPTTIDLNDTSASNIRSYYSSLNNLSQSERQGNNLLKNLKTILKNGQKYYSYDSGSVIWQIYEISDRDWEKSPASSTTYGTYNSSTKKITNYTYGTSSSSSKNNPYIHALYINRDVTNQTTAWDDHQQTQWGINREHVWPKAEGFETSGAGGARGDPMHLMAGNGYANNIHSNYYYGYVNTSSSYTNCGSKYSNVSGNLLGKSKTLGGSTNVFEPQDSDKGDIARAIFYMVARYNYLSGSDSDGIDSNNPNLALTQQLSDWASSGYSSTTSKKGYMGIMTDLLAWHHADPVDEYEIHRNNILYTNYTNNRNPFIDFPEWADFIWGSVNYSGSTYISHSTTPTGYATPSSDIINGYNSGGGSTVSVTGVTLDENSIEVEEGSDATLTATVAPSNATNQNVTWSTSDPSVATVSGGIVTGIKEGSATITITTSDGGYTASCTVTVTKSSGGGGGGESSTGNVYTLGWGTASDSDGEYTNFSDVSGSVSGIVSFTTAKNDGTNTPAYNSNNKDLRLYYDSSKKGNGCSITITPASGVTITDAVVTASTSPSVKYTVDGGSAVSVSATNNVYTISDISATTSLTLQNVNTNENTQLRIKKITLTYDVEGSPIPDPTPTELIASVSKSFYVGETITKSDITVEDDLGNEITDFEFDDYMFTYDDAESGGDITEKDFDIVYNGEDEDYINMETVLTVDVQRKAYVAPTLVNDKLDVAFTEQSGNSYGSWTNKSAPNSDAVYAGNNAAGNDSIQMRSGTSSGSNVHSGIISTTSGGIISKITVTWNSNSINGRSLNVYGSNTAYSSPNDLYESLTDGDLLGSITKGTSTSLTITSGSYAYIGLRSDNGAIYLDDITITYGSDTAINVSNYIMYEDTNNQCTSKLSVAIGYLNNLSSSELTTFTTSNDYVIIAARQRLEAWARSQGKSVNYTANDVTLQSNNTVSLFVGSPEANNMIVILLVASLLCSTALTTVIVVKKRKRMM